jgi:hypothetical protein
VLKRRKNLLMNSTDQAVADPAVKSSPSRKPRLERVASLKPCEMPLAQEDKSVLYQMCYVTFAGKQTYKPCTKGVYQKITGQKLDYHKKSDFVLTFDRQGNTEIVTHIVEQPKPDLMPGFKREDEKKEASNALIIALYGDGSLAPINVPERVTESTIQSVMDHISEADSDILPGSRLGDHVVLERREVVGATEIHVDPMPRPE